MTDNLEKDDDEKRYIKEEDKRPTRNNYPGVGIANDQTFACPQCGSYNTSQGTYFEMCNTCGWHQGY